MLCEVLGCEFWHGEFWPALRRSSVRSTSLTTEGTLVLKAEVPLDSGLGVGLELRQDYKEILCLVLKILFVIILLIMLINVFSSPEDAE